MDKMTKFITQIAAGIATLKIAHLYISGISFTGGWETFVLAGFTLGFLNFFIKPILKIITLPLRILTLGFFSLIINIVIVYFVDLAFYELQFERLSFMVVFIVLLWLINLILSSFLN